MKSLHLFAGIGGGILADAILGHEIVGAVEILPYCQNILKQHQQDGFLNKFPVYEDICEFDCEPFVGKVDLVCGGFPCQDISAAGAGRGIYGEKSRLFFELVRVCGETRPRYIFLENSPRITSKGLDSILKEIALLGFDAEWSTLSAGKCGAPHMRDRWWCLCKRQDVSEDEVNQELSEIEERWRTYNSIASRLRELGNSETLGLPGTRQSEIPTTKGESRLVDRGSSRRETAHSKGSRLEVDEQVGTPAQEPLSGGDRGTTRTVGWWKIEPRVGRLVNEFPRRVDAIKGLGNAQVPVVAALAFYLLLRRFCKE